MDNRPIGILDSGVGGLTVVRELIRQLPHEEILYIGDSARAPYGSRPIEQICRYTWELVDFLLAQDVKMIVLACNTATAVLGEEIKEKLAIPVIGVVSPGAIAAIQATSTSQIGVIGTVMTIRSDIYRKKIQSLSPNIGVKSLACPRFAPIVESGEGHSSLAKKVIYQDLAPLVGQIDTLVLGCTHYPLLKPIIQNAVGKQVRLVDSGAECVRDISVVLDYFDLYRNQPHLEAHHQFYTTANRKSFQVIAEEWLGRTIQVEHVTL